MLFVLIDHLPTTVLWKPATVLLHVPVQRIKHGDEVIESEDGFFIDVEAAKRLGPIESISQLLGQPAIGWTASIFIEVEFGSQFTVTKRPFSKLADDLFQLNDKIIESILVNLSKSDRKKSIEIAKLTQSESEIEKVWSQDSIVPSEGYIHHVPLSPSPHMVEGINQLPVLGEVYITSHKAKLDKQLEYMLIKTGIDSGNWIFPRLSEIVLGIHTNKRRTNIESLKKSIIHENKVFLVFRFLMYHGWLYNDRAAYKLFSKVSSHPDQIYEKLNLEPPASWVNSSPDTDIESLITKLCEQYVGFIYCIDESEFKENPELIESTKKQTELIIKQLLIALFGTKFTNNVEEIIGLKIEDADKEGDRLNNYCVPLFNKGQIQKFLANQSIAKIDKLLLQQFDSPTGAGDLKMTSNWLKCVGETTKNCKYYPIEDDDKTRVEFPDDLYEAFDFKGKLTSDSLFKLYNSTKNQNKVKVKDGEYSYVRKLMQLRMFYIETESEKTYTKERYQQSNKEE